MRVVNVSAVAIAALAALTIGVARDGSPESTAKAPVQAVRVTSSDFEFALHTPTVRAGMTRLVLDNEGPTRHELVLARTTRKSASLPLADDGLSVDETSPGLRDLSDVGMAAAGAREVLDLRLVPGHYVVFCNLEGHYLAGMHADLTVRGR